MCKACVTAFNKGSSELEKKAIFENKKNGTEKGQTWECYFIEQLPQPHPVDPTLSANSRGRYVRNTDPGNQKVVFEKSDLQDVANSHDLHNKNKYVTSFCLFKGNIDIVLLILALYSNLTQFFLKRGIVNSKIFDQTKRDLLKYS